MFLDIKLLDDLDLEVTSRRLSSRVELHEVNEVNDATLVYAKDIEKLNNKDIRRVIIGADDHIHEGINLYTEILNRVYFVKFKKMLHLTSNNLKSVKKRFKEHLTQEYSTRKKFLNEINLISDELIMNAFFNAPVDEDKKHIFKSSPRNKNVVIEDRGMDISHLTYDDISVIRCSDLYGSFSPGDIVKKILQGRGRNLASLPENEMGAGIGMSLLYNYTDALIFDVLEEKTFDVYAVKFRKSKKFKLICIFTKGNYMDPYSFDVIGDKLMIYLKDSLDETTDFSDLPGIGISEVILDFENLVGINSIGIRVWVDLLEKFRDKKIIYKNCKKIVVDQLLMIHDLTNKHTFIESFDLTYHCHKCSIDDNLRVRTVDVLKRDVFHPPELRCTTCNKKMDLDFEFEEFNELINKKDE